jgi:hypothetical protein
MKSGDLLSVQTFSEGVVKRVVVEVCGNTVYICREEEWERAKQEGREPDAVGFNRRFVV